VLPNNTDSKEFYKNPERCKQVSSEYLLLGLRSGGEWANA